MSVRWLRLLDLIARQNIQMLVAPSSNCLRVWNLSGTKVHDPFILHVYHIQFYQYHLFIETVLLKGQIFIRNIVFIAPKSLVGRIKCQPIDEASRSLLSFAFAFRILNFTQKTSVKDGTTSLATFAELFVSESPKRNQKPHLSLCSSSGETHRFMATDLPRHDLSRNAAPISIRCG